VEHEVGTVDEVRDAGCRVVEIGGRRIGVISAGDSFYTVHPRCPHKGADMCAGTVSGTFVAAGPHELVYGRRHKVLRCPWHGWEFDVESGVCRDDPKMRVAVYPVRVENGRVLVKA
jgi:nitrite reductase (NADH) small subunit